MEIILLLGIILVIFLLIKESRKRGLQKQLFAAFTALKPYEEKARKAVDIFGQYLSSGRYFTNRQYQEWKKECTGFSNCISLSLENLITKDAFREILIKFSNYHKNGRRIINRYNAELSRNESEYLKKLLVSRNIPFNSDQLMAAVSEEDNTLVVAGAGTGKTTTILGKLAYLIDRLRILPEDILLLSFTGKAVEELEGRVKKHFPDINIEVRTFHSFGLSIIGKVLGSRPDIAFENNSDRQEWIDLKFRELLELPKYLQSAVNYFAYLFKPVDIKPQFNNLDEYYKYIKTENVMTFQKEWVKSQQKYSKRCCPCPHTKLWCGGLLQPSRLPRRETEFLLRGARATTRNSLYFPCLYFLFDLSL